MDTRAAREIANRNNPPRLIRVGDPTREIRARGEKFDISPFGERERERGDANKEKAIEGDVR